MWGTRLRIQRRRTPCASWSGRCYHRARDGSAPVDADPGLGVQAVQQPAWGQASEGAERVCDSTHSFRRSKQLRRYRRTPGPRECRAAGRADQVPAGPRNHVSCWRDCTRATRRGRTACHMIINSTVRMGTPTVKKSCKGCTVHQPSEVVAILAQTHHAAALPVQRCAVEPQAENDGHHEVVELRLTRGLSERSVARALRVGAPLSARRTG